MESYDLETRMTAMEKAYGKQSELMRELREAVTVTATLEARQGRVLKEHGEWLEEQDKQREKAKAEHDARMKDLDERIAALVSGFGAFIAEMRERR